MSRSGYMKNCKHFLKPFFSPTFTPGQRQAFVGKVNGERRLEETAPLRELWWTQSLPI
jgi:hypothetical protein